MDRIMELDDATGYLDAAHSWASAFAERSTSFCSSSSHISIASASSLSNFLFAVARDAYTRIVRRICAVIVGRAL